MLFNSAEFLFAFLPIALLGYYLFSLAGRRWATGWLVLASLYFYADWKPEYLWIILASIGFNYAAGRLLADERRTPRMRRTTLAVGIGANLAALGYYKYTGFVLENVSVLTSADFAIPRIVLPLAISFFTFQQIAYLSDAYRGLCREYDFLSYCLFVTFFPQLIAGPIVHHGEMLPQFAERSTSRPDVRRFDVGLSILAVGLFKKVVIADGVAPFATSVFAVADAGGSLSTAQAWGGALAYTLQLYFDFSGYSDMAVGAARLFGITLPLNFFSPYKSTDIIEFWRRWHITLSRFLRDYLYVPLGGNRLGPRRRYANLMWTMVLGGIWHGAGWNFLVWGTLHGVYLIVNHAWRGVVHPRVAPGVLSSRVYAAGSWCITFVAVVVGWVFFRAETLAGALGVLGSMFWPSPDSSSLAPTFMPTQVFVFAVLMAITLFAPNVYEVMRTQHPVIDLPDAPSSPVTPEIRWRPSVVWAACFGIVGAGALLHLGRVSEFLYFQF